jgi:hypothetical protein
MADESFELFRAHRDAQTRYTYFLLAAAGGGIALAVNQTTGHQVAWSQLPLAIAVLSWGMSFFCGCRYAGYVLSILYDNSALLRVQEGRHPLSGDHPEAIAIGSGVIRKNMELKNDSASRWARSQFGFLVSGAMFFVAWHVLQMFLLRHPIPWLA